MKIRTTDQDIETRLSEITITEAELGERDSLEITRLNIENDEGVLARFWIKFRIKNGRPTVSISTKTGKDLQTETTKFITGTFNIVGYTTDRSDSE